MEIKDEYSNFRNFQNCKFSAKRMIMFVVYFNLFVAIIFLCF